jgi:hypothetical protein
MNFVTLPDLSRSAAVQKPGAVSAFSVPRWAPVLESQKIPESLLFWAFPHVTARKAHCTVATRPSQIPTEENLKCVQVLDLYSTSTIGRERRRGRDLIRHGSPRAQGGYDDNSSRDDARLLGRREHGLSLVRLCLFVGAAMSYPLATPERDIRDHVRR